MAHRWISVLVLSGALLVVCGSAPAAAQETPPTTPTLAELARLVEEQRSLIAQQAAQIEALRKTVEETSKLALDAHNRLEAQAAQPPAPSVPSAIEARLTELEKSVTRTPDRSEDAVTVGDFPGSIRVPGTNAAFAIGGLVRMTTVKSFDALGTDDRFVTSSIPIAGTEAAGKGERTTYSSRPSRFNIDVREPTNVGPMRAFIEADFAGSNNSVRFRHAYGQWRGFTVGQTWSTFSDRFAEPDGIDFEGLNAISLFRQAQIRVTKRFGTGLAWSAAVENPAPDSSAADGTRLGSVNQVPDVITRLRWEASDTRSRRLLRSGSHVQAALLLRQVRAEYEPNETLSTSGVGYHVSGRVTTPWLGGQDQVTFAAAGGKGIGRYITDLGSEGGQDAVYNPADSSLNALPVFSGYLGYEHWWNERVRSVATWGTVWVDNFDFQFDGALQQTDRASINAMWSPIARVDLVAEFLWGQRRNKDGQRGTARQLQLGTTFRF